MDLYDIIALAVIQGITEFLPISSSGHLVLWPLLTGRPDQGPAMDVAVHIGTLVAVCVFFRSEFLSILSGAAHILTGRRQTAPARLAFLLAFATLPAIAVGLALKLSGAQDLLRSVEVIAWATVIGAILLWLADRLPASARRAEDWSWGHALLMGLAQATALIPGTSRSGITMTMGRWLGYNRTEAARLSLLMAIPVILAAGALETRGVLQNGGEMLGLELVLGALLSCLAALAALWLMMRMFAATWSMTPFVIYRLILGLGLLWITYA